MPYVVNGHTVPEELIRQESERISRDLALQSITDEAERARRLRGAAEQSAVDGPMRVMSGLLRQGRPANQIMEFPASGETHLASSFHGTGRNDMCPCGSGLRYKR